MLRFLSRWFRSERAGLSERARVVVRRARASAARLGHDAVTPLHLALGLLEEGRGVAAAVLERRGITLDDLARELAGALPAPPARPARGAHRPLTEAAEAVLARAGAEARSLGHGYVATEHLLLALLRAADTIPAQALARRGVRYADARAQVQALLSGDAPRGGPDVLPGGA
jgi:ATP-dependent Clp protease ATP-binding subunit ClpC